MILLYQLSVDFPGVETDPRVHADRVISVTLIKFELFCSHPPVFSCSWHLNWYHLVWNYQGLSNVMMLRRNIYYMQASFDQIMWTYIYGMYWALWIGLTTRIQIKVSFKFSNKANIINLQYTCMNAHWIHTEWIMLIERIQHIKRIWKQIYLGMVFDLIQTLHVPKLSSKYRHELLVIK